MKILAIIVNMNLTSYVLLMFYILCITMYYLCITYTVSYYAVPQYNTDPQFTQEAQRLFGKIKNVILRREENSALTSQFTESYDFSLSLSLYKSLI